MLEMVFSSLKFTFYFLPAVMLVYYLAKEEYRNGILLFASLLFYASGEPTFVFVMIGSILINYFLAGWIDAAKQSRPKHAKGLLLLAIAMNLLLLYVFKYLDFSISLWNRATGMNLRYFYIALPIGISFFTFQAMSYVIDVYRGTAAMQKNVLDLALYISFFPQLIAGPIVRYTSIAKQLKTRNSTLEKFCSGGKRFILGFAKKVILANNLSVVASEVFSLNITACNPLLLWLGSICYSLQIFYDFSGYSDMAIGLGRLFGFEFEENFCYPYISKSVTEFWRRWHISLGRWFRDYVYIPLGGSRVSISRHILNLFAVWLLTGIWHGASLNFVMWGLFYFLLLVLEKYLVHPEEKTSGIFHGIWQAVTLLCVNFGWVMFNSASVKDGLHYCLGMLGGYGVTPAWSPELIRYLREYGFFIAAGLVFSSPVMPNVKRKISAKASVQVLWVPKAAGYAGLFLWAVSYLILGLHNPFIYFNF